MEKLLSIIIPSYNMEGFLSRCLDSLILDGKDILTKTEVLIINDGSKDNTLKIAKGYEAKYPEIFKVIDKENGNYGSCVNRGLSEATGMYIKVLDADDWFDTKEYTKLIEKLASVDVDLVLHPFNIIDANTESISLGYAANITEDTPLNFQEASLQDVGVYTMHGVIYRRSFLRSIMYHQTEGISYTDTEWVYNPMPFVSTFCYINCNVYQYLLGREGQTMDNKVLVKSINQHITIAKSLIENCDKSKGNVPEGSFSFSTIERQIRLLAFKIFRTSLLKQEKKDFNSKTLMEFDEFLIERRPFLFSELNDLVIKKFLPIRYVSWWRHTGHRLPVDAARSIYRILRYGNL